MKHIILSYLSVIAFLSVFTPSFAQTPSDAIMMGNGQVCLAVIYSHDSWDEYWEGTLLRTNGNIGTLTRQTIMPMVAVGLGERLNIIAAVPWVKTEASAGYLKGASGLQDWGIWLKGKALDLSAGPGNLTFHATGGLMGPSSNYLADYAPFSLGLGCIDLSAKGIFQYKMEIGPYLRAQAGYHWRGNSTVERDYYYTTTGVYADGVDMPNAITYGVNLGSWLFNDALKVEVAFDGLTTQGGFDIRRQDGGFPSNKMIFTRVGGSLQYYPGDSGFGFLASAGQVLTGRNVGKSMVFSGGITYQFGLWNKGEQKVINN